MLQQKGDALLGEELRQKFTFNSIDVNRKCQAAKGRIIVLSGDTELTGGKTARVASPA